MDFINKIYEEYFNENIFKEEMGDSNIILEEFIIFVNKLSITDKIKLCCINNKLSKNDLLLISEDVSDSSIMNTLSRLNKNIDLTVTKIDGLNHYQTTGKGIKKIELQKFNFIKLNKYICAHDVKSKIKDVKKIMKIIHHLYTDNFMSELRYIMDNDLTFFEISFEDIASHSKELMYYFEDHPKDCLLSLELVLNDLVSTDTPRKMKIGFKDLPSNLHLNIGNHRVEHLNGLYEFEGIIKRKTEINPKLVALEYLCTNPDCTYSTERLRLPQIEEKIQTLKACPRCKAPIDLVDQELVDNMFMILEEDYSTSNKTDSNLSKINLVIQGELVQPMKEKNYRPGDKVKVIGFLEKKTILTKGGTDSVNFKNYVNVINIIASETDSSIDLNEDDIKEIKEFSKNVNVMKLLQENFITEIKGYEDIKNSLMLQLVGASSNHEGQRDDTHILLVGEPGVAKTRLALLYSKYASKVVYTSGTNTSKAGLTGACIKDEFTGDWAVEAGSLPKANGGIAVIDELDKMGREDSQVMHDALESQIVPIRKAISIDLICKCSVLACANPKYGYFDSSKDIVEQINLVPSLLNRFDLIYILKDEVNKKKDAEIFNHIIESWNGENNSKKTQELSLDFMRKYFHYCKFNNKPNISKAAQKYVVDFTQDLRFESQDTNFKFNARQLNGVIRLSFAYAKLLFKKTVDIESVKFAIELYTKCLKGLGSDFYDRALAAEFDLDNKNILDIINQSNGLTIEQLKEKLPKIKEERIIKEVKKLIVKGQIFEPRKGEYRGLNK